MRLSQWDANHAPLQSRFRSLGVEFICHSARKRDVMTRPPISRGFRGRRSEARTERIPPGQHLTSDFPVLSAGPTPHTDLKSWNFSLCDRNTAIAQWSWEEFEALPQTSVKVDIHCVT